jgi:hypothetical protein
MSIRVSLNSQSPSALYPVTLKASGPIW